MTYDDFVKVLAAAGLSGREFARLLRLNANSVANYKRVGEVPSHWAIAAVLMRQLAEHHIDFRPGIEALDIEPKARRGKAFRDLRKL